MHLAAVGSYAQNLGEGLDHTDDEADTDFFFFFNDFQGLVSLNLHDP